MRKSCFLFLGISLFCFSCNQQKPQTNVPSDNELAQEFQHYLMENLLHSWYPRIVDPVGGYYTNFSHDWELLENQDKMIVSQARDLWTACKAAERFPEDLRYIKAAHHGFQFLNNVMWDQKNGGFHRLVSQDGKPIGPKYKKSYGIAFGIYGAAAYAKLAGSREALELAKKAFLWLEDHAHDPIQGGYYDWMTGDGISFASPQYDRKAFPTSAKNVEWKDYNSSIHIMEAFVELYAVWPDDIVRQRLIEMLEIVRDVMTTEKGYLRLYFKNDWSVVSYADSNRATIEQNLNYDHVTPGHDIETAYLLLEASHALGLESDTKTLAVAKRLVDHTLKTGFDDNYTGLIEIGYYFDPDGEMTILKHTKTWWAQVEGLNALLLFARLFPGKPIYKEAFLKLWDYVKINFIDHEHGGWYSQGLDKQPEAKLGSKAHQWKSCYHTARGLMNCAEMLECQCPPFQVKQ